MTNIKTVRIAIVVGEPSGDQLAAKLMPALEERFAPALIQWSGVGGERMAKLGFHSQFPLADIAVMGFLPVLGRLRVVLRRIRETAQAIISLKPDILVIIDSPDFTHRVAKRVRGALPDLPVVDYVSPSVWAWRSGRAAAMRRYVDHVLALLPFEPGVHERLGGPDCTYVGHPLIERLAELRPSRSEIELREGLPLRLVVLPGSRKSEIRRLMPIFGLTVERLLKMGIEPFEILLPAVDHLRDEIEQMSRSWLVKPTLVFGEEAKLAAFRTARAALAASGTVTLELALSGVPMVVAYQVSFFEGQLRHVIRVPSIVLPNLILGRNVIPEHIQGECNPVQLANSLLPLLTSGPERKDQMAAFEELDQRMATGTQSPSELAANIIAGLLNR